MEGVSSGGSGGSARHAQATIAKYNFASKCVPKCNLETRNDRGFTLVEVLAALMFMAIAIPAILGAISASSRSSEAAERTVIATQLAENQLSQVVIDQANTTGSTTSSSSGDRGDFGENYPGYRWEMKQEPWIVATNLTQYTVQVFFSVKGQERSVEVSTLIGLPPTTTP